MLLSTLLLFAHKHKEIAKKVVCTENSTWVITESGHLYGCGSNSKGQQGTTKGNHVYKFTLRAENVKDVWAQSNSTFYLTNDGYLYCCGDNTYKQQCMDKNDSDYSSSYIDTFVARRENIRDFACSYSTSFVITQDLHLYGCGENNYGQIGYTSTPFLSYFPLAPLNKNIIKVVCSRYTTLAINTDQKLLATGRNNKGQLGVDVDTYPIKDILSVVKFDVEDVCCTNDATYVIGTDKNFYAAGSNQYGQQGITNVDYVSTFTQRNDSSITRHIACNTGTAIVVDDTGYYFSGLSDKGQSGLSISGSGAYIYGFEKHNYISPNYVKKVISNSYNTWVLYKNGILYATGQDAYGCFGKEAPSTLYISFTKVAENVKDFCATNSCAWYIDNDGFLWGAGKNDFGQQGSGDTTDVLLFTKRNPNYRFE